MSETYNKSINGDQADQINYINYMDVAEFRRLGLLQEVNRRLLHPCGLALEVVVEEDGSEHFGGVWDYRHDPEGMVFGDGVISQEKIDNVDKLIDDHSEARVALFGSVVQS